MTCCGEKLQYVEPKFAEDDEKLKVEKVGNELYISSNHPVEKEDHINFVAYVLVDSFMIKRHYPEWDLDFRFPFVGKGKLIFNSTTKGLFQQRIEV